MRDARRLDCRLDRTLFERGRAEMKRMELPLVVVTYIAAVAIVCLCIASATVAATVRAYSESATQAYLHALYTVARSESVHAGASVATIESEAINIGRECPSVLYGARKGIKLIRVDEEVRSAILISGVKPYSKILIKFAAEIEDLHLNNRRLAKLIRSAASLARMEATIVVPDVCADIKVWIRGGYRMLPRNAVQFVSEVEAIESGAVDEQGGRRQSLIKSIFEAIKPHKSSSELRLVARMSHLEATTRGRFERAYRIAINQVDSDLRKSPK